LRDTSLYAPRSVTERSVPAPDREVVQHARLLPTLATVPALDLHDPVAAGERQRRVNRHAHHLEDDRADPDGERHREPADQRQPRILHEHPAAELHVERQAPEPGETPLLAQ
jgi:hypothetical protein